jgi:hypothetical protein
VEEEAEADWKRKEEGGQDTVKMEEENPEEREKLFGEIDRKVAEV